jgi:chromosome segregation ATPase
MTAEENLRNQINELQTESKKKDGEIANLLDKIEELEDEIIRYSEIMDDDSSNKRSKKSKDSKLKIELDAKDREIRELKNRMGFLRKEKIEIQKELEDIKNKNDSVISVEELREKSKPPLNALLQELQDKIRKQESIIKKLKYQNVDSEDFSTQLKEKDEKIEKLQEKVEELAQEVESANSKIISMSLQASDSIQKNLLADLQDKLNKTRFRNEDLKRELERYKKSNDGGDSLEIKELKNKISELTANLEKKENQVNDLNEIDIHKLNLSGNPTLENIVDELQSKLNKSRIQVKTLQDQLKAIQIQSDSVEIPGDNNGKLKIQREMASFLQKQLKEAKDALKIKEEEIITIKNEAIRIKRKYEDLENLIKQKESDISNIQTELDSSRSKTQIQSSSNQAIDPEMELRIKELESYVEDLKKQNIQQRIELSELRKK